MLEQLATHWPAVVSPGTPVVAAAELMNTEGVGALVVLDDDRVTGIVTDRDIVVRGVARRIDPDGRIDSIMSTDPILIDADASIADALALCREHDIRRLPVTRGGQMVGMVTTDDLLLHLAHLLTVAVSPVEEQARHGAPAPRPPAVP